jgi:2'-5' RNA ligase
MCRDLSHTNTKFMLRRWNVPDALTADWRPFAVWLIPEKNQAKYLSGILAYLSQEYKTPVFEPHCTLVSGRCTDIASVKSAVEAVSGNTRKITLKTHGITCTDDFFKTVLIELEVTAHLEQVFQNFKTAVPGIRTQSLYPHISLLYKDMDREKKEALADSLEIPLDEITFDTVKIMRPTDREKEWYAIDGWQTVSAYRIPDSL